MLVHGAWHGAWCWERLTPELERLGHGSVTMDLPIEDGSATFADYAAVVDEAVRAAGDPTDLVLVGHSLGGMVIPLVAARRPVALIVFLCGVVPKLGGMPWDDAPPMGLADYGTTRQPDGSITFGSADAARRVFYDDCSAQDATWAYARLRPFNNASLWDRPYPLGAWPEAPAAAIACADDVAIYAEYQAAACRSRLGIDPVLLPGHHSPFIARPALLAEALDGLSFGSDRLARRRAGT